MNIQELDVPASSQSHCTMIRSDHTDNPKHVKVRESDITTSIYFNRLTLRAFYSLFLGLHTVNFPIGHISEPYLIADMMFDRHCINSSFSGSILSIKSIGRISIGGPDIFKDSTSIIRHPKAPILRIPSLVHTLIPNRLIRGTDSTRAPIPLWSLLSRNRLPH